MQEIATSNQNPLTLIQDIDVKAVETTVLKVRTLQSTLKNILTDGHDYGKIPGCGDKATLLKPGAEKILMAMGITSTYELVEHTEKFDGLGFFAYTVKCILNKNGIKITEGLGHANSKEKKWAYEYVYEKDLPEGCDKGLLKKKEFNSKQNGTYYKYEIEADANSKANTILKMAKKRAQIDAVLSVASLSEIFTQDFDDLPPDEPPTTKPTVDKVKENVKKAAEEFNCSGCGAGISKKVYEFSITKYGQPLCYDCQKQASQATQAQDITTEEVAF
jgi:hypothetical protein